MSEERLQKIKGSVEFQKEMLKAHNMTALSLDEEEELIEEIERLNNIINELDKQNGELGADLSIIKDRVIKTNWWLENMLKQATNRETKAIINGALDLLLGSDKE